MITVNGVTLNITALTIRDGSSPSGGGDGGGGIRNDGGTVTLLNSTVSGNSVVGGGGGIFNSLGSTLTLINSTVSGNSAGGGGGGIRNDGGTVTLLNSTVSGNSVATVTGGFGSGGIANFGTVVLSDTIVASNTAPVGPDCIDNSPFNSATHFTSHGYNLIGTTSECSFTSSTGDLTNVDPHLGALQDNGGPTFTMALLPGSPAIDDVPSSQLGGLTTDQRGDPRPDTGETMADIGAYEVQDPTSSPCTTNCPSTATPELGSGDLLATGLLPIGAVLLYRRRRTRRAARQ